MKNKIHGHTFRAFEYHRHTIATEHSVLWVKCVTDMAIFDDTRHGSSSSDYDYLSGINSHNADKSY